MNPANLREIYTLATEIGPELVPILIDLTDKLIKCPAKNPMNLVKILKQVCEGRADPKSVLKFIASITAGQGVGYMSAIGGSFLIGCIPGVGPVMGSSLLFAFAFFGNLFGGAAGSKMIDSIFELL